MAMRVFGGHREELGLLLKPLIVIAVLACLSAGAFFLVWQHSINTLFETVERKYRQDLINIVSIARHAIEPVLSKMRRGNIRREEAILQIRNMLRTMTYEDQYGKNYVFMSSYGGVMLVQPFEPEKELTNQWNLQDKKGLYIIRELVRAAKTHPQGSFVRYDYHLPGVHTSQEKLAYVVGLPELECYIGTGMYMARSLQEQRDILAKARYAFLGLFTAMLIPISVSIMVIWNRNRRLLTEIRTRRKAEENLRDNEAKYRSIFENIGKGIFQTAPDGLLLSANPALARICGYDSPDQMLEKGLRMSHHYAHPADRDALLRLINEKGSVENHEVQMKQTDGSVIWVAIGSRAVKDEQGNVLYYEGTVEDIDARKRAQEKLRISEEKFAKVFIMAPEMIGISRLEDGRIADVNLGFEDITGWKRDEAVGRTSSDIHFWANPEDRARMVEDLKAGREIHQREIIFRRKDGSSRIGLYSARQILIDDEPSLIFVMQDVTQRKETQKALEEKEERLNGITRNIPGSVFQLRVSDHDRVEMTYVSERLIDILNLPADAASLFPAFLSCVYPGDRDRLLSSIQSAAETGTSWNFEGRFKKPSGDILWFQGFATPARHEKDLIFSGILLDISERKRAEEKSRQSEEKFLKIFMTAPDGIAISRMSDGLMLDINRVFEELTMWKRQDIVGKTSLDIQFWADHQDRALMVSDLEAGRDVLHREFRFRRKDGVIRTGIYSARSIEIAEEKCLVFILNDITDRKQLEAERRKLEQQLYQSQKLDAIGQLASGVAHDFNNILMGIQGNATLMMMDYHPQHPHYQKLSRIEEHVKRGANLTRQLLGFAREGKYEVRVLHLNDLIRKVAQFFLETHREIEADYRMEEALYTVEADAGQIEQVLLNLFINAGHAMPKGGHLYIQTQNTALPQTDATALQLKPGRFIKISITDTGVGMDQETLKRIFEPFFTTRLKEGGSGLGLASAYGIIRNHGGAITVVSEPHVGSTFNIYLPASEKNIQTEPPARHDRFISGSGGILLVDDEPMILGSASEMLRLLGYTVYPAASGQEAVAVFTTKRDKIDLVLLDMMMPGMSGAEVLKNLKSIHPGVQVILSSGYGMQGEVQKALETGCAGFVQKPYSFAKLSQIIHQVLHPA